MTPCVTRARRLVIELPAPVSMLRAHMGDAGFRSFTHMHFRSIARTAMLRFRVWCLATPEKEELEAAKSTSPTFFPKAILRQSSQKPFQQQLLPTSQSIILSETVWRLASFRKLWSLVTADQSQLRAVCEGPGWGRKSGMWYFSSFKLFP